jgi:hypothetical protein
MSEVKVSMVNTRGRVVWVEESRIGGLRGEGWRIIVNPKETYYPQYDQTAGGKLKDDEVGGNTRVLENDSYSNQLGIVVI